VWVGGEGGVEVFVCVGGGGGVRALLKPMVALQEYTIPEGRSCPAQKSTHAHSAHLDGVEGLRQTILLAELQDDLDHAAVVGGWGGACEREEGGRVRSTGLLHYCCTAVLRCGASPPFPPPSKCATPPHSLCGFNFERHRAAQLLWRRRWEAVSIGERQKQRCSASRCAAAVAWRWRQVAVLVAVASCADWVALNALDTTKQLGCGGFRGGQQGRSLCALSVRAVEDRVRYLVVPYNGGVQRRDKL